MTANITSLDAHEQPSDELRAKWKKHSKMEQSDLFESDAIDDLSSPEKAAGFVRAGEIKAEQIAESFSHLNKEVPPSLVVGGDAPIYYHPILPGLSSPPIRPTQHPSPLLTSIEGLLIIPSVVPPEVQKILLRHLIHRDLSNPRHQTNLHPHYDLPYPDQVGEDVESFFSYSPDSPVKFQPKDPEVHKSLSIKQVMDRRLHWVTLGGQYDWTSRVYPDERPPEFPPDVAAFLQSLFPETVAQAAIVNIYTAGDTMMMHRDVSEETDKGLISISIGCDSLFMIAPNDPGKASEEERNMKDAAGSGPGAGGKEYLLLRLRSGDAIYMTKESRFAWHGVPKVLKGTCPEYLEDWPAEDGKYEEWRGWMKNKRVNLNVRQMRDEPGPS